jgi:hypothetical protein
MFNPGYQHYATESSDLNLLTLRRTGEVRRGITPGSAIRSQSDLLEMSLMDYH